MAAIDKIYGTRAQRRELKRLIRRSRLPGYRKRALTTDEIRRGLRGKNLACWCAQGQPCHADVLLEIANG